MVAGTRKVWPRETVWDRETLWEYVKSLVFSAVIAWFLVNFVIQFCVVRHSSMYPTLEHGERLLINKVAPKYRLPVRGEIIVFADPRNSRSLLVKRVVGLPGDTVQIQDGVVLVNGEPFPEVPTVRLHRESRGPVTVPPGAVYVLGDNRPVSLDSREFGPIPLRSIEGYALVRIWPISRAGSLMVSSGE